MNILKRVALLTVLLFAGLANAHSSLKQSKPANNEVLLEAPASLQLAFTMPVKLVRLQLITPSEKSIKLLTKPSNSFAVDYNIALPTLDYGSYKVKWIAMGKDAHKMKGEFTFALEKPDIGKNPIGAGGDNNIHD